MESPLRRSTNGILCLSRRLLQEGTERFREYYRLHPENLKPDNNFRKNPGLLAKGSRYYDALQFAASAAGFNTVAALHPLIDNEAEALYPIKANPEAVSLFIKEWLKKLGALEVGFTELRAYHKYSTIGRGPKVGQKVILNHKFAIVFTVEMDKCSGLH